MSRRSLMRLTPALAAGALLCLAAAAPAPQMMPAPPPLFTYCTQVTQLGGGSLVEALVAGQGVSQPLPAALTVAACSLRAEATGWSWSDLRVKEWDPLTLAPDPTTIALRTAYFDPSRMNYYSTNSVPAVQFVPPVVTRSVSGVAEPPRPTVTVEVHSVQSAFPYSLQAYFDADGNSAMPAGSFVAADGTYSPLPGAHPVVAHAVCTGDADLQQLRVAQSVRRTDATLATGTLEIVQRFRVPEAIELRWIELAVASGPGSSPASEAQMPVAVAVVGVVDGATLGAPTTTMPPTLVEALFSPYFYLEPGPRWASHTNFDYTIVLQPGHDYWLYARNASAFYFYARTLTGGENATFTSGVGPLYTRGLPTDEWTPAANRALAFTVVGRPAAGLGGGTPPAGTTGIRMQVSPNPARDLAEVRWSGAVGPVRLEVLDARGRRIATSHGGAAGTWQWATRAGRGDTPASGVYFVHARDTAGGHAVERVVIVR